MLAAAGQAATAARVAHPAGLTDREVEVLRLIARGGRTSRWRPTLGISPKTVGHHVEHIYAKAGVTTRAGRRCSPWSTACCTDLTPGMGRTPDCPPDGLAEQPLTRPATRSDMSATSTAERATGSTSAPATGRRSPSGSRATGRRW